MLINVGVSINQCINFWKNHLAVRERKERREGKEKGKRE